MQHKVSTYVQLFQYLNQLAIWLKKKTINSLHHKGTILDPAPLIPTDMIPTL